MSQTSGLSVSRNERGSIPLRPGLVLLAPFLATTLLSVPNLRLLRDVAGTPDDFGNIGVAMMGTCLVVSLVFAGLRRLRPGLRGLTRCQVAAAAALYGGAQVAMWALGMAGVSASAALWAIGIVMGACTVPLLTAWMACYDLDFRSIMFYGSLSAVAAVALSFVIGLLVPAVAALVWCLCALAGAFAPVFIGRPAAKKGPGREAIGVSGGGEGAFDPAALPLDAVDEEAETPGGLLAAVADLVSTIWIPLLGLLLCLMCSSMVEVSVDGQMVRGEYVGLVVAGVLAVGLCCLRVSTPFVLLVDKIVVPALVAFAMLLTVLPDVGLRVGAGASLVFVPLMFMAIYAVASTVSIRDYSRPFVAGTVLAACCVAMLVGSAVKWQGTAEDGNGPVMHALLFVYYAVIVVDLGYASWRALVSRPDADAEGGASVPRDAYGRRVDELAAAHDLTPREAQVLLHLAGGHGSKYIAKTLFISDNTVRTHTRNIYRKLGVGSREELLVLVGEG